MKPYFILMYFIFSLGSCGDNSFKGIDSVNPGEEATKKLEEGKPEQAEKIILAALGNQYKAVYTSINDQSDLLSIQTELNSQLAQLIASKKVKKPKALVSILASAKAQIHGIDPFTVALSLATSGSSSDSSNELTRIFPVLPTPNSTNIRGLNVAMTVLNSIGSGDFTKADNFKVAIFLTSSISLACKSLDTDGDGAISTVETAELSDEVAVAIFTQLASATLAMSQSSSSSDGDSTKKNSEAITGLNSKIQSMDGDTDTDKLRNFLSQNNQ